MTDHEHEHPDDEHAHDHPHGHDHGEGHAQPHGEDAHPHEHPHPHEHSEEHLHEHEHSDGLPHDPGHDHEHDHDHPHDHAHDEDEVLESFLADPHRRHLSLTVLLAVGLGVYLFGWLKTIYGFDVALLLALTGGYPIYRAAVTGLLGGKLTAALAVSLAAVAALVVGQYAVAAEVVLIMMIGEALENFAVGRTRSAIAALLALRPATARVRRDEGEVDVPAEDVDRGETVIVRPGERIPVDGRVAAGASSVDQSPITGESLPADKAENDEVFAGTINLYGVLEIEAERVGTDTTLEQIIHLVEEAEEARAPTQRLADRYAGWFVPIVLTMAGLTWWITGDVIRSVAVLVVACPCALVLATPTAIAAGVGRLVRRGVLVKGGAVLEQVGKLRCVIFDKTGTLTCARLRLSKVAPAEGVAEDDVLTAAAAVEYHSEHPIGRVIAEHAAAKGMAAEPGESFTAHPGRGASAEVAGVTVRVGSERFVTEAGAEVPVALQAQMAALAEAGCSTVLVARDSDVLGAIAVEDTLRHGAAEAVAGLKAAGVEHVMMLTGDNAAAARAVGEAVGIEEIRSELLPADKVQAVRAAQDDSPPVAMVGDGINDAPSLVAADVGIALAEAGTDVAIASADVVLIGDRLELLAETVDTGRRVLRVIWQNILGFALAFNAVAVLVAAMGWISPVVAAVVHQVSSLVVCLNSLRLLVDVRAWGRHVLQRVWAVRRWPWRRIGLAAGAVVLVAWLASGVHTVNVGQVGLVQRFGRVVEPIEQPGLHYRLPWPLARHRTVAVGQVRRVEIGFRTAAGNAAEPPAYEWNTQHRGGRTVRRAEEADVWAGNGELVDVTLVVHYQVTDPVAAVFALGQSTPGGPDKWDALVRSLGEAALRDEMSTRTSDAVLSDDRTGVEAGIKAKLSATLNGAGLGLSLRQVWLADVHPPLEVVPDFRDVVAALEEKEARINQAEAYRNETEALARGQAEQTKIAAQAYFADRTSRSAGRAYRFAKAAEAYAGARALVRLQLYLKTLEEVLAGRRKIILDRPLGRARRMLYLGREALWPISPAPADGGQEGERQR